MPDSKLSDLPSASSVADADLVYIVQSGASKKVTRSLVLSGTGSPSAFQANRRNSGNSAWELAIPGWLDQAQTWQQQQTFTLGTVTPSEVPYSSIFNSAVIGLISATATGISIGPSPNGQTLTFIRLGNLVNNVCPRTLLGYGPGLWSESSPTDSFGQDIPLLAIDNGNNLYLGNANNGAGGTTDSANNYFCVQAGKTQNWNENLSTVMQLTSSVLEVRAGTSAGPPLVSVGGALFDDYTDTASAQTGGSTEDLYTHNVLGNTLVNNGDKITSETVFNVVGSASAVRNIQLLFAGSSSFTSGSVTSSSSATVVVEQTIERESSTVVRAYSKATPASWGAPQYTRLTGLTLTGTNVLKTNVNTLVSGSGASAADITAKMQSIRYIPAAKVLPFPLSLLPTAWVDGKVTTSYFQTTGGSAAVANNDPVGSWIGQDLQAYNFAQTNSGRRPLLKTAYQNGFNAIVFDGIDDFLVSASATLAQPFSIYAVIKLLALSGSEFLLQDGASFPSGTLASVAAFSGDLILNSGGTLIGNPISTNTMYVVKVVGNSTSSKIGINGTDTTGDAGTASWSGGLSLGGGTNGGSVQNGNVAICEMIAFSRLLTGGEETNLYSYLRGAGNWNF